MFRLLASTIGFVCFVFTAVLVMGMIVSHGQDVENVKEEPIYWKDVLIAEGHSEETITKCENILDDIGIYNLKTGSYSYSATSHNETSIWISCFEHHVVIISFEEDEIKDVSFYGNTVYDREEGRIAKVYWEERRLVHEGGLCKGMAVRLID